MFCFDILACRARSCVKKFSSCQVFLFWVCFLFRVFVSTTCSPFFLRDTDQVVTGHTPHWPPFWSCSFSFFLSPPRVCHRPFWPCVPSFLVFSRGAILGPARFGVLGSLGTSWGLSSLAPSEAPFSDARRQRCLRRFSLVVFVFPLLSCLRLHTLEGPPRDLAEASPGDLARPGRSDSQGSPSRAEGWSPPCLDRFFLPGVCVGVAGAPKALLCQWAFLGGGALLHGSPPTASGEPCRLPRILPLYWKKRKCCAFLLFWCVCRCPCLFFLCSSSS